MANPKQIAENTHAPELDVEVLYQKLGDRWFAFSIVNDEVFMSPVSDDQVASAREEASTYFESTEFTSTFDQAENF